MAFNENLKYFMECKEIQSKELAAKTDISINTINSYLKKSGSIPDIEKAVKIAKVLNIPAELLVTGISLSEKKIEHMDRTNVLKPEIVEIEKKLVRFSQKDLEIIAQLIQSVWEKYER
ncbi:MAG: helix-turn-helix transcriptional regulator [Treponemataceae bacterium]|nr:helix-turn-helix transcriptional regulator [Treponemataceae bacterium]